MSDAVGSNSPYQSHRLAFTRINCTLSEYHVLRLDELCVYTFFSPPPPSSPLPSPSSSPFPIVPPFPSAPIWSQVTAEDFVRFVAAGRPNVFECLCDTVSSQEHELKRVKKSVDRTLKFLDQIISAREGHEVSMH